MMHAPTKWNADLAYLVGYITTDGCLSSDGRHIAIVSKDRKHLEKINGHFNIGVKIGTKASTYNPEGLYYHITFGGVGFYRWLETIGLMPNKSKRIGELMIPRYFFGDFLRGHLDGDGSVYSYFDLRWRSSYMIYVDFLSASLQHILWLQKKLKDYYNITAPIKRGVRVYKLSCAKRNSLKLLTHMYSGNQKPLCLDRKYNKVQQILADVLELVDWQA